MFKQLENGTIRGLQAEVLVGTKTVNVSVSENVATAWLAIGEMGQGSINISIDTDTGKQSISTSGVETLQSVNAISIELAAAVKALVDELKAL